MSLWQAEVLASEGYAAGLPWIRVGGVEPAIQESAGVVAIIDLAGKRFHVEATADVGTCVARLKAEQLWVAEYSFVTTPDQRAAHALAELVARRLQATGRRDSMEFDGGTPTSTS